MEARSIRMRTAFGIVNTPTRIPMAVVVVSVMNLRQSHFALCTVLSPVLLHSLESVVAGGLAAATAMPQIDRLDLSA